MIYCCSFLPNGERNGCGFSLCTLGYIPAIQKSEVSTHSHPNLHQPSAKQATHNVTLQTHIPTGQKHLRLWSKISEECDLRKEVWGLGRALGAREKAWGPQFSPKPEDLHSWSKKSFCRRRESYRTTPNHSKLIALLISQ